MPLCCSRKRLDATGQQRQEQEILEINVRPGWKAGTKITFQEKGEVVSLLSWGWFVPLGVVNLVATVALQAATLQSARTAQRSSRTHNLPPATDRR